MRGSWDCTSQDEEIVYSPNKYLETEGTKDMHCLGSYGPMIADACRSGDNIRMMQIMQAAGTCLNILESITVKHWADDVFKKSAPKCIVWEGKDYTPVEFMKAYAIANGEETREETAEAEPTFQF